MEKRKLSGKTILKLSGALLALAYLGFCLYAGITGKFPNMHKVEHVMRFGELKNWVSGGMSAVMIFALCITSALNDLNLQKGHKKSFLPLFLTMILPIILYCSWSLIWILVGSELPFMPVLQFFYLELHGLHNC